MNTVWQFQPIGGSYLVAFAVTMLLLLPLFFRPDFAQVDVRRRRLLIGLRLALASLLFLGLLRPAWITTQRRSERSHLAILYDVSRSMLIADGPGGETRWQGQQALLHRVRPQLEALQERYEISLSGFAGGIVSSEETAPLKATAPPPPAAQSRSGALSFDQLSIRPEGDETDIGQALVNVMEQRVGERLAGVILISDGSQRTTKSGVAPQQAARQMDRRATPLYTVALGQAQDQSQSRDVAIENLADEFSVFVKNELALQVGVRIQGFVNQSIPVHLEIIGPDDQRTSLGPVTVVANQDNQIVMADFSYRPELPGKYRLEVSVPPQSRELAAENNRQTSFLEVREGGLRVLYLTSALLHPEKKFIRLSLASADDIDVDLFPIDLVTQDRWPLDLQGELALQDYDVYLIGDLDASALRPDNWERMASLVEDGRGLMMVGGFHSFGPGGYAESALAPLLPIVMDRLEYQPLDPQAIPRPDAHLQGPLVMMPSGEHAITYLGADNEQVWGGLKPLLGANRFGMIKDRCRVLAQTQGGEPLLVQGDFVQGRVLAFAADSTYLWWRHGAADAHKRFWRQAILWLARRDAFQANRIWIRLPQRRFHKGNRVDFWAGYADAHGEPVPAANLVARVTLPDGSSHPVELAPPPANEDATRNDERTHGSRGSWLDSSQPGLYRVEVQLAGADPTNTDVGLQRESAEWVVLATDRELSDPVANPGLLDLLAKATQRVGGRAVPPEQLGKLLEEFQAKPIQDEIESESKWQLGDTPWDAGLFFSLVVGCLTVEWVLRKKWGMV